MKTAAVITEFNPFHKGHEYFLREVRKRSGADVIIAVMSGDFVQRGEPAVLDKYARTEAALKGGCDLVFELPLRDCLASAGEFAAGALSIIDSLGITDELWFGSECGEIKELKAAADILCEEPEEFRSVLQNGLKNGLSYPAARSLALSRTQNDSYSALLDGPNNILGIEYCIAARKRNSRIGLRTLRRIGAAYDDVSLKDEHPSALAVRSLLYKARFEDPSGSSLSEAVTALPSCSAVLLKKAPGFLFADDFSDALRIRLLEETEESLCGYKNVAPDLARRIKNKENSFLSFTGFAAEVKSRNYTYSHVSRALMCIVLKVPATCPSQNSQQNFVRLLGMKKSAEHALRLIHQRSGARILSSPLQFPEDLCYEDRFASSLYESIRSIRFRTPFIHECSRKFLNI